MQVPHLMAHARPVPGGAGDGGRTRDLLLGKYFELSAVRPRSAATPRAVQLYGNNIPDSQPEYARWVRAGSSFLSGLTSEARRRRLILALQVYVDDSGAKGQESPAVLAGLLTTAEEWMAFAEDWSVVLARTPMIGRFKMDEAAGLDGPFYRLSATERDDKLRELATVVVLHHPTVFRASIDLESFAQTLAPLVESPLNEPYFQLFFAMIWRVTYQLAICHNTERFEIIFDRQVMHEQKVKFWYPVFVDHIQRLAADQGPASIWAAARALLPEEPVFRTDDEFMPLQCADLFAWLLRSEMLGQQHRFGWLRPELPPVSSAVDLNSDYWRTRPAAPEIELVQRLIDPTGTQSCWA